MNEFICGDIIVPVRTFHLRKGTIEAEFRHPRRNRFIWRVNECFYIPSRIST